ncbi:penicillin acylase family protein [Rheinheimera salexigens]|uniref:Penicillin amidase n=1 Tax=Rheinheimera salexigens TaxID=1628148 RepID=A0A1E7Q524_9GAMM|nr:penicillin acylase family protein [Rheinheimera salexigens]OEY69247.1 penicillin amidase [Rheinheimera salexigens]
MNWWKWLFSSLIILIAVVAIVASATIYSALYISLPAYDTKLAADVSATVRVDRDNLGYLSIHAANRQDASYALGFAHAQERFFQMDLLRRNAAGELAGLFGSRAVAADKALRQHRFRHHAEQALQQLTQQQNQLLQGYTNGVNAGLNALTLPPFEYWILRQQPQPWQATDSFLVIYSMYLDLQGKLGRDEYAMTVLKNSIDSDWYHFLQQHSQHWQAAIDASIIPAVLMPRSAYPSVLTQQLNACVQCDVKDATDIGSNNFAVSGTLTHHGSAILADDMHLGLRVPNTWYKAQLNWRQNNQIIQVTGLSLPGAPAIVVGSNTNIAWGFTNSTGDWHDLIKLTLSDDGKRYLSQDGWQPLQYHYETIKVAHDKDQALELASTHWGPVVYFPANHSTNPTAKNSAGNTSNSNDNQAYALRWVGYDSKAVNFNLIALETASTVQQAVNLAPNIGIPAQNLVVADAAGHIAWTIAGAIPKRSLDYDWDTAQDWSQQPDYWQGYIDATEQPAIINPSIKRLWSANARTVGADMYAKIGNGGYDLGARGQQIRDQLLDNTAFNEADLHQIQLDNNAKMLARWQQLLLSQLTAEFIEEHQLQQYQNQVSLSSDQANVNAIGYTLVKHFRQQLLQLQFAPLSALLEQQGAASRDLKFSLEPAIWQMLQQKRADTVVAPYTDWQHLMQSAILQSKQQLEQQNGSIDNSRWGLVNQAKIQHPLALAIPYFGNWLNMPNTEMNGDSHMPRVQGSTFGQSQRLVVAPGQEHLGILTMPTGQSGHPLSPFYRADHTYWLNGVTLPFLPGAKKYQLLLTPQP